MIFNFQWNIIVNRSTCTEKEWRTWRTVLDENKIPFQFHLTDSLDQVSNILSILLSEGNLHFLFVGGDGTIHHGGNLLLQLAGDRSRDLIIGALPGGTGNDWVRTYGIESNKIAKSLKAMQTVPLNVIKVSWPDGRERYAFNMVGGALDAAVVDSLLKSKAMIQGAIKYPFALVKTLLKPHTWAGSFTVDGKNYSGDWLTIQAGFGKYCGGGMYVLPHAQTDKAALLLMRPKTIGKMIISLSKLYNGKIAEQKESIALHFTSMEINHSETPIPIEADGEWLGYTPVKINTQFGVMNRLISAE